MKTTPEDCPMAECPMMDGKPRAQNAGAPWVWLAPLAFSIAVVLVTAGINWGQITRQDADRAAMFKDLKEVDTALSSRIDRLAGEVNVRVDSFTADKARDNERIVRLEERFGSILDYVKKIDENLETLLGMKRGGPSGAKPPRG